MTTGALHQIILLVCLFILTVIVQNVACVMACLACRVKVERCAIFHGKPIATFQTPLCPVAVGFLPIGGYVQFDIEQFRTKPLIARWFVVVSGPLTILVTSSLCLRYDVAAAHFASGFVEIVRGALAPFEHGVPLIRAFFQRAADSVFIAYGIFAAKWAAVNLFPLAGLAGSRLLIEIVPKRDGNRLANALSMLTMPLGLALLVCWAIALVSYFRQSPVV